VELGRGVPLDLLGHVAIRTEGNGRGLRTLATWARRQQIVRRKKVGLGPRLTPGRDRDVLAYWLEAYFALAVTSSPSSQKVARRDLQTFCAFVLREEGSDERPRWTPRLSRHFQESLRRELVDGKRRYSDRTINRILAHLKTWAKWIHKNAPFPVGDPMEKITLRPVGTGLEIEKALTPAERRRLLDAADVLVRVGGLSRDRSRFGKQEERPRRKGYRPWRNRAIVYTLVDTGMRRAAVAALDLDGVEPKTRTVSAREKGGLTHAYQISREGLEAIAAYIRKERGEDEHGDLPALFLPASNNPNAKERLSAEAINNAWNEVCRYAGVSGRTPHSARHAMGRHLVEKTGNIAAVQRQLGHKNAAYCMQYSRITRAELNQKLDDRE